MGLSDDGDEDRTRERFDELCCDLNMDLDAKTAAWQSYTKIIGNYTLEVIIRLILLMWLVCHLYWEHTGGLLYRLGLMQRVKCGLRTGNRVQCCC